MAGIPGRELLETQWVLEGGGGEVILIIRYRENNKMRNIRSNCGIWGILYETIDIKANSSSEAVPEREEL